MKLQQTEPGQTRRGQVSPVDAAGADLHPGLLPYVCPRCKGPLTTDSSGSRSVFEYVCATCASRYPVIMDIPDFRVFPDPWIGLEEDRDKARRLAQRANEVDFAGLVEWYWRLTPDTPSALARHHIRHALSGVERGFAVLDEVARLAGTPSTTTPLLDLGCGTGGLLAAAAVNVDQVVGVDIAFRWLIVARKRLEEAGCRNIQLVCCCAEALPFPDETFGLVVAANVIEHSTHQVPLVREILRVVTPGGATFLSTPNRFSLGPEPHVHVWGVGLLPRRLMSAWVRMVRGVPYRHHRLLSVFELRRVLKRAGADRCQIVLPRITSRELMGRGPWVQRGASLYGALLSVPVGRWPLYFWGPAFHAVAWRRPTERNRTG